MNRKVGFWRWLFDELKEVPSGFIEALREPFGEMAFAMGILLFGVLLMPIWFDIFNIPISTFSGLTYFGILFGFATLLVLHGAYWNEVG